MGAAEAWETIAAIMYLPKNPDLPKKPNPIRGNPAALQTMSTVKCRSCGARILLDYASPYGRNHVGFICDVCYRNQWKAVFIFLAIVVPVVGFLIFESNRQVNRARGETTRLRGAGGAPTGNASYTRGQITTTIREIMGFPYPAEAKDEVNWQDRLLEPLDSKNLIAANFGYSSVIMDWGSHGQIVQSSDDFVKIVVTCPGQYHFEVTQIRLHP